MSKKTNRFKNYRGAIIGASLLITLILAYVIISSIQNNNELNPYESKLATFYTQKKDNIKSITVKNHKGEYTFTHDGEKWLVAGDEGIELNQQKVDELAYSLTFFDGTYIAEKGENMEQYGLSNPNATIQLTLMDGKKDTFYLGNNTYTATGYYMIMEGNDNVYEIFINKGELFLTSMGAYRPDEFFRLNAGVLKGIEINSKENGKISIQSKGEVNEESMSSWIMTSPYYKEVFDQTLGELIIDTLSQPVKITEYVEDHPKSLEIYGLATPVYSVTFQEQDKNVIILFGNETGNDVYVKKEGYSTVYKIGKESFSFRSLNAFSYISKLVYSHKLADLSELQISAGEKNYRFDITGENSDLTYQINGKQVQTQKVRSFYENLSVLTIRGVITEAYSNTPEVTIRYQSKDGSVNTVVYYPYKDRFYAASVNGKADFYVQKADVTKILDKLDEMERRPNE